MHTSETEKTNGYFVILNGEEIKFDKGRSGIFYHKKDLIETLKGPSALKERANEMNIVEIEVPASRIIHPNCIKFCILGGKYIPITKTQAYTEALLEIEPQEA